MNSSEIEDSFTRTVNVAHFHERYPLIFSMLCVKQHHRTASNPFLPPATKLGQGYIFTGVCDSVHGRGGSALGGGTWSRGFCSWGVPGPGGLLWGVPGGDPPQDGYCCGRYASYWNAFLLNGTKTVTLTLRVNNVLIL